MLKSEEGGSGRLRQTVSQPFELQMPTSDPTDPFTVSEPHNPSIDVSELNKICRSPLD